jgi:uncharacterized protein YpmS
MRGNERQNLSAEQADDGKRWGCLWLIILGLAFIALFYGVIIYTITREQTAEMQANELSAIRACWVKSKDSSSAATSRAFAADGCREMEKQFRIKYGREPE